MQKMQSDLSTTCGKRVRIIRSFDHFATVVVFLIANNGDEFHIYTVLDRKTGEIGGQWSIKSTPKTHKKNVRESVNAVRRALRMSYIKVGDSEKFLNALALFSGLTKSQLLELSCSHKYEVGRIVDAEFFERLHKQKMLKRYLGFIRMESICKRITHQNILKGLE